MHDVKITRNVHAKFIENLTTMLNKKIGTTHTEKISE
jgi:hypothetical protein